jgi:hypothetical protein
MDDLSCLELADVRHYLSQIIHLYVSAMEEKDRGIEHRLSCAQLAEAALHRYLLLLNETDTQREIAQMQRLIGQWRSTLPKPFDD